MPGSEISAGRSPNRAASYAKKLFYASRNSTTWLAFFVKNVILTESKEVSIKASGTITLYNEFSMNPQKLVSGTFLVDDSGKTYKIDSVVTIPGYKLDNNKKVIPDRDTPESAWIHICESEKQCGQYKIYNSNRWCI